MNAARQTWIETSHGAHYVDALELVGTVLLEDRSALHGVFIRPRRAVYIARVGIPRRRRVRMIIGYFAVAYDDVMRKHTAHRFVEAATDRLLRHFETRPCLRMSGVK